MRRFAGFWTPLVASATVAYGSSASLASLASGRFVMPMTLAPQDRYSSDSARVEKAGPSMHT